MLIICDPPSFFFATSSYIVGKKIQLHRVKEVSLSFLPRKGLNSFNHVMQISVTLDSVTTGFNCENKKQNALFCHREKNKFSPQNCHLPIPILYFFNYFFVSGDKFIEGDNLTCAFEEMQIDFSIGTMKGPSKTIQVKGVFDNRFQVRLVTLPTNLLGSHLY